MKTLREMMDIIESAQTVAEGDDLGHLDAEVFGRIDKEKQRKADLKKNDPAAYAKELEKDSKNYGRGIMGALRRKYDQPLDEEGVAEGENQEYTVRVVDEEGSGYTVKVTATSEQGALHKAIVKVRNQYDAYPEHARIIRQDVEEEPLEETEVDPVRRIEELFQDKR